MPKCCLTFFLLLIAASSACAEPVPVPRMPAPAIVESSYKFGCEGGHPVELSFTAKPLISNFALGGDVMPNQPALDKVSSRVNGAIPVNVFATCLAGEVRITITVKKGSHTESVLVVVSADRKVAVD